MMNVNLHVINVNMNHMNHMKSWGKHSMLKFDNMCEKNCKWMFDEIKLSSQLIAYGKLVCMYAHIHLENTQFASCNFFGILWIMLPL